MGLISFIANGGVIGAVKRQIDAYVEANATEEELHRMSEMDQRDRKMAEGHRGGFYEAVHGTIDGHKVTVSFGWGNRDGETFVTDGYVSNASHRVHGAHNHYGSGRGSHNNVRDRFKYTGPAA